MDSRMPAGWQGRPDDPRPPQHAYQPSQGPNYSHLPLGPSLAEVVASNDQTPYFAHRHCTIDYIQHILAQGQYSQFLHQADGRSIQAIGEKCREESKTFIDEQYHAVQGDLPILTAYDYEIRDLELELAAHEAQQISAISLPAGYQTEEAAHGIKKTILNMMRSRATLLQQDYRIRIELLQIELGIHKFVPMVMLLQTRIKHNITADIQDEQVMGEMSHQAVRGLLPWKDLKDQKRAELQRCRETRAGLEQTLRDAKGRVQVLMPVKNGLK